MLIIRGVNVFPTQIEELVLRCPSLAPHFALEINRPDRMDEVVIEVEPRAGTAPDAVAAATHLLLGYIKDATGISARVRVLAPGTIARSVGKAARVRDLRMGRRHGGLTS